MTHKQAIKYLESFINYEKISDYPYKESIKLERIKGFLDLIGNPQLDLKVIHVAGSKGKGSTCAFIANILAAAGFKTGLYTSPHLVDFRERVRILTPKDRDGKISAKAVAAIIGELKPGIEKYNKRSRYGEMSFFEIYTALAFLYFKRKKADFAVLETGLGGRLDATNNANSLISVITPISYEHMDKLGDTLRQIAFEKAGIIKASGPKYSVIASPQEKEAMDEIRTTCGLCNARLVEVGKKVKTKNICSTRACQKFDLKTPRAIYKELKIKLLGKHQIMNASTAVAAIEALDYHNISINKKYIQRGLSDTYWPGRLEVIGKNPLVIVDGCQNRASAAVLKEAIRSIFKFDRLILIFGACNDKDIKGMLDELLPVADDIILTRADNPRAAAPAAINEFINNKNAVLTASVKEAMELAKKSARKNDLILVAGSLFVVGELKK